MKNYMEIKDKQIISFGDTTSDTVPLALVGGKMVELTDLEYKIVQACRGDLEKAFKALQFLISVVDDEKLLRRIENDVLL